MEIEGGSFAWSEKQTAPTLRDINMRVNRGKLIAVVGQVGSGKSSLISAILGHMDKVSGQVKLVDSVAYVPQQAWIQNATVRNNILFGKGYSSQQYDEIVSHITCGVAFANQR